MSDRGLELARNKMTTAGVAPAAIETFTRFYRLLESGETGLVREDDVEPLTGLERIAARVRGVTVSRGAVPHGDHQAQRRARHLHGHGPREVSAHRPSHPYR